MFWIVLGGIGLVLLIVGSVVQGFVQLVFAPHREPVSEREFKLLATLSVVAFVAAVTLAATLGGWWFVVSIAMWLLSLTIVRNRAPVRETKQQRIAREGAEKKRAASEAKRATARKAVAERKRIDVYGKDGVGLMTRAQLAVDNVMVTEAVKEGWLGEPSDLDISVDLALIGDTLSRARRIEKVAAESKSIPKPNGDDVKLLRGAERSVRQLRAEATQRVGMLNDCARKARQVDQTLAREREQARPRRIPRRRHPGRPPHQWARPPPWPRRRAAPADLHLGQHRNAQGRHVHRPSDGELLARLVRPRVGHRGYAARAHAELEQLYVDLADGQAEVLREMRADGANRPVLETVGRAAGALLGAASAEVAPDAQFSDLGGDSLSALTFANLLHDIFAVDVPVGAIVSPASDLASIAAYVEKQRAGGSKRPTYDAVHGRDTTYAGQLNVPDMFTRMMLSLAATGIAPSSFYELDEGGSRQKAHFDGLPVEFIADAISTLGANVTEGFETHHVMNPYDDASAWTPSSTGSSRPGIRSPTCRSMRRGWIGSTTLRALPEKQRAASLLPLIHNYQKPEHPINGSLAPADHFRASLQEAKIGPDKDIPHITAPVIVKYVTDLRLLSLL